jgi:hypothetical protein
MNTTAVKLLGAQSGVDGPPVGERRVATFLFLLISGWRVRRANPFVERIIGRQKLDIIWSQFAPEPLGFAISRVTPLYLVVPSVVPKTRRKPL